MVRHDDSMIDKTEARLEAHEELCALRYEAINARLKRLESILIASAGFVIAALTAIAFKIK
jgi:hypothetical protein